MFEISSSDGVPLYLQLIRQIRYQIAAGGLDPGDQLPSVRKLSEQLVINPNTVVRAYRELELEGLVVTRQGAGVFVAESATRLSRRERHKEFIRQVEDLVRVANDLGFAVEDVVELVRQRGKSTSPRND